MKTYLASALVSAALMAGPALSQTATPPEAAPAEAAPPATSFAAPEGYTLKPDWTGVTADHLSGAEVAGMDGTGIGKISDVVLGSDGTVSAVIVDVGGFLGMGAHTVSLGADQISLYANADGEIIAYSPLTKEALEALPEYTAPG